MQSNNIIHRKKLLTILFFSLSNFCIAQNNSYPFQNTSLSFEKRVTDFVSRLTLEEKVAQMLNSAPSIPRLGIPAYDWWSEVLHGVARTPYKVTVYPQAIAMAATFDTNSIRLMADYSAIEGRAIFNKSTQEGKAGQRYVGLTYWTPNINIFRDPRLPGHLDGRVLQVGRRSGRRPGREPHGRLRDLRRPGPGRLNG